MGLSDSNKDIYLQYYISILNIISAAEDAIVNEKNSTEQQDKLILASPFFPNINVYGVDNFNESYELLLKRTMEEINSASAKSTDGEVEETEDVRSTIITPTNYYPNRGHPYKKFDYESSEFFIKDGRKLYSV
jgi:hypothetical protein